MHTRLLLMLFIMLPLFADAQSGNHTDAIKKVLLAQKDAWNSGDMEGYMAGYWKNDSLTFVGKSGITRGWNETFANYKKSYPDKRKMGELQFEFKQIEILAENEAFVLGKWQLTRADGNLSGYFTLRMRKLAGEWKVVLDHSS